MNYEIELKAWIDDPGLICKKADELYTFVQEIHKSDMYYRNSNFDPPKDIRIRTADNHHVITSKQKSKDGAMEINQETEFKVDDPQAFVSFLSSIGFTEYLHKIKRGKKYTNGDLVIEVCTVEQLGDFIEIECLTTDNSLRNTGKIKKQLHEVLMETGVPKSAIEPRYYMDLLKQNM